MRKLKQPPTLIQSLEELISDHDKATLSGALESIKSNDLGWRVLRAILVKEYQNQVLYAMEHSSKSGEQIEAAYRSGCAQTLIDIATSLIDTYINKLQTVNPVVEVSRPNEE